MGEIQRAKFECPKCGSDEIDHPRSYGPGMRFTGCQPICKACGHEGENGTIAEAFEAWRKP